MVSELTVHIPDEVSVQILEIDALSTYTVTAMVTRSNHDGVHHTGDTIQTPHKVIRTSVPRTFSERRLPEIATEDNTSTSTTTETVPAELKYDQISYHPDIGA